MAPFPDRTATYGGYRSDNTGSGSYGSNAPLKNRLSMSMRSSPPTNLPSASNNNNNDLAASTVNGSRDARPGFMRMGSFRGGGGSPPSSSLISTNNDTASNAVDNSRPGFMRMTSERRMGKRRSDVNNYNNNSNGGNSRSFLQRRNSSYDVMMGNHSHHGHSQTSSISSDVGVFSSFRSKSCDQQIMLQDLDYSTNSNRASVSDYQNVFQQMKQENPTTSMGALHHNTMTKIAELKALEEAKTRRIREEFLRQEEEERIRNQTVAKKYVDKWVDKLRLQPNQNEQSSSMSSQEYLYNSNTTTARSTPLQRGEALYSVHNSANLHNASIQSMDTDSHSPTITNTNIISTHNNMTATTMQNSTSIRASFLRRVSAESSNASSNDDLNFAPRRSVGDLAELRNSAIAKEVLSHHHNHHSSQHSRRGSSSRRSSRSSARSHSTRRKSKISSCSADSYSNDVDRSTRSTGTKSSLGMLSDASGLFMNADNDEEGSVVSTDDFSTSGRIGVSELSSTRGVAEATREEDDDTREGLLDVSTSSSSTSNSRNFMQQESSPASVVHGIESLCDDTHSVAGTSKDATSEFDDDESMCAPRSDGLIVGFVDRSTYVYIKHDKEEEEEDGLIVGFVDRSESSKEEEGYKDLGSHGKEGREELLFPLRKRTGKGETMGDRVFAAAKPSPYAPVSKTKKKGNKWFKQKHSRPNSSFGYY